MSNKILGIDAYWLNFAGLMLLTLIEVAAVGADLGPTAGGFDMTERQLTLWIPVSYTHLTLPTRCSV